MAKTAFHHALKINEPLCYGCTHCMTICPTQAIRVRNGKAIISGDKCIDCGMCFKACPVKAIHVEQDDFSTIFNFKYRVALYPSILTGQFDPNIQTKQIVAALLELGFTDVFEVEHGADFLAENLSQYIDEHSETKPLISSFCPAVVRLIQVKFPSLVQHIIKRKSPLDIAAIYYRKMLEDKGIDPKDIGIFYITPCAAKIAAVKSPVGEDRSSVDGVINLDFIYNRISLLLKNNKITNTDHIQEPNFHYRSIRWSLTNGETDRFEGRCLAIDEIHNAIEFLEKIEDEEVVDIDFIEIRACDESCAGGILNVGNRFITVEKLKKRTKHQRKLSFEEPASNPLLQYSQYLSKKCIIEDIQPRSILKMDENTDIAISKLEKVRRIMCHLPGIDCGVCGSPTCQAQAESIVQRQAQVSDCIFVRTQMQRTGSISKERSVQILQKIWSEKCLEKDCTKRGAKNENR